MNVTYTHVYRAGWHFHMNSAGRLHLKCDGTRAETRFRLSAKRTSPFKSAGESVQSTTGSRGVHISGSRLRLKCDGTRAETRFRLLAKRTSPFNP